MKPTTDGVEIKLDKRTKEYKSLQKSSVENLLTNGLSVSRAVFNPSLLSFGADDAGSPETALFSQTPKAQKRANMWLCPGGVLVIEQRGRYKVSNSWTELDLL